MQRDRPVPGLAPPRPARVVRDNASCVTIRHAAHHPLGSEAYSQLNLLYRREVKSDPNGRGGANTYSD